MLFTGKVKTTGTYSIWVKRKSVKKCFFWDIKYKAGAKSLYVNTFIMLFSSLKIYLIPQSDVKVNRMNREEQAKRVFFKSQFCRKLTNLSSVISSNKFENKE
ncbi:hypothetical protein [Fictibacillus fluitans]|uniref:Uncharacterized protein n=1 Tax=Fictibacillus fluitans TaxID=3058422 RepID=A0ABT8I317_9BACL|nr:hypothetical protein [Fictibacillus sp. NE201]MDN4527430.1 hypothetical protein [Fictibacillus sp. NE201]